VGDIARPRTCGAFVGLAIPILDAVISGDVACNGIHLWLAFTDHDQRMQWISSVEHVEAFSAAIPRQP
jgi:hypothetical protein